MKNIKIITLLALAILTLSACTKVKYEYFEDGSLKSAIPYRFGKEHGLCKYYFINAPHPIKIEVEMKNGKKHGSFVKYFINGRLDTRCTYQNDLLEGVEDVCDIDGYRISSTTYLHGKKNGPYTVYHPNGEIMEQGAFSNDLFDGKWYYYDERGVLVGEGEFNQGTGVQMGYNANGNLVRVVHYQDNHKQGEDVELTAEGDTLKVTVYDHDRIVSINGEMVSHE
ncbi:MAG: hypothetical protein J5644_05460 [Bacteroidales bacterium]|nr:hypothetical protein [Bacteroidales bacterium]